MPMSLPFVVAAALVGVLVPVGYVLALDIAEDQGPTAGGDDIRVETDPGRYSPGERVRIYLRNVGADEIEGSPRIMVMTTEGGLSQAFSLGGFHLSLDPGDALWVEWLPGPQRTPYPCAYGHESASGADASYSCPANDGWQSGGGASEASSGDASMYYCEECSRPQAKPMAILGLFGEHADAMVIEPEPEFHLEDN